MTESDISGKIAVLGPREEVLPFLALGAKVFFASEIPEARRNLLQIISQGVELIFLSDFLWDALSDIIQKYADLPLPCISALPGKIGNKFLSRNYLKEKILKGTGINLPRFEKK